MGPWVPGKDLLAAICEFMLYINYTCFYFNNNLLEAIIKMEATSLLKIETVLTSYS